MQCTRRLLATVAGASGATPARYLSAGNPTGLAGLLTHPSPRSTLVYLYTATLQQLEALPSSSAYRASVEALTKHRLAIVDSTKPEGFEAWQARASKLVAENPAEFEEMAARAPRKELVPDWIEAKVWGRTAPDSWADGPAGAREEVQEEWDGEKVFVHEEGGLSEGGDLLKSHVKKAREQMVDWEGAPRLEAKQISEIEEKIGAGLIEEVIEVAKGELTLVGTMNENKVWEELSEKAPEGQWTYFARQQHMPGTEEPGNKS